MHQLNKIPFFEELTDSKNILLAGTGGGFDIYSGIPIYLSLKNAGKNVVLANYSFTWLSETTTEQVFPFCYKVKANDNDRSGRNYFPEKYLALWLALQGENPEVFAFERCGINQLKRAYNFLIKKFEIDTVILVDGGTDSLMFGDEEGLGTPQEDICSMAAVHKTGIKKQFLVNLGFGVDHFHGVSHYRFLENVAELAKDGGYLGLFQLTKEMDEAKKYINAVEFVNKKMVEKESIVSNSIASAVEGNYGNYHTINRTAESVLWINPLMTIYWCFDLRSVIAKNKYYHLVKDTTTMGDLNTALAKYRRELKAVRKNERLPI
jgi:hypothetical protein